MYGRSMPFVDALHFLANRAGIPLPSLDPAHQQQWQQLQQERHDLEALFRAAAEFYSQQLTQEHINFCQEQWGLTLETVQQYKLGFAPVAHDALQRHLCWAGFAFEALQKSGLVIYAGGRWHDFFQGRIIFPYWRDLPNTLSGLAGTPLYFIGRRVKGITPDTQWEKAKYKKQLVHGAEHCYVSPTVTNTYFYGEHALRGLKARPLLVTEGVADCLVALQVDIPTISPVTTRFAKACYSRLLQLARQAQRIIICNDNEDSQAGTEGALDTAAFLDAEGMDVRLVSLPRPHGVSKIDLADFFKSHTAEDFQCLRDEALAYLEARLATYPVSTDGFTNCQSALQFVTEVLHHCPNEQKALAFLRHRVKVHFKLRNSDINDLVRAYRDLQGQATAPPQMANVGGEGAAAEGAVVSPTPESWPDVVDGAQLLADLAAWYRRYVVLPEGAADMLALWTIHTYAIEAAQVTPRLAVVSPQKRCGKTTLIALVGSVTSKALAAANITAAALFRAIEQWRPTMLIDEADTFLRDNEELRGVLNAGHYRPTAYVIRAVPVGDTWEPQKFSVWGPVAIALIGSLPSTLADRSIAVRLRRKTKHEQVERLRLDRLGNVAEELQRRCLRWAQDHLAQLKASDPAVPETLNDRAKERLSRCLGSRGRKWGGATAHGSPCWRLVLSAIRRRRPAKRGTVPDHLRRDRPGWTAVRPIL
jgi:hypothetical protein